MCLFDKSALGRSAFVHFVVQNRRKAVYSVCLLILCHWELNIVRIVTMVFFSYSVIFPHLREHLTLYHLAKNCILRANSDLVSHIHVHGMQMNDIRDY